MMLHALGCRSLTGAAMAVTMAVTMTLASSGALWAEGNLASAPERLPDLEIRGDLTMSQTAFTLETGRYYRWRIISDGQEEFAVLAPDLMRNAWIDQIVINDLEVKPMGGIHSVEFDDAGTIDIWFVPIRPGRYPFWVDGYEERGMIGAFTVN